MSSSDAALDAHGFLQSVVVSNLEICNSQIYTLLFELRAALYSKDTELYARLRIRIDEALERQESLFGMLNRKLP